MELKKFMRLTMFLALSIVLSIIESMFPILNGIVPGLKLGLANIVIIIVLYIYGFKDALYVSILRVILVGLLRTGLFSINFLFSISGAILSLLFMNLFKKINKLSIIGISVIGSIAHSIGQIIIAIIILKSTAIIYYLPWLLLLSIPTGIIVGIVSKYIINNFSNLLKLN